MTEIGTFFLNLYMLQLLTSDQIREADAYTIKTKPISSIDLMESAALAFVKVFKQEVPDPETSISIYCGTGNNGGDGLAIARLLKQSAYTRVSVNIFRLSDKESPGFRINLERLHAAGIIAKEINAGDVAAQENARVIIDALIGSGLNKSIEGPLKYLITDLNRLKRKVYAVDIPSGLPSEGPIHPDACVLKASLCISFQRPKINFFFPESAIVAERFKVVDIGLDETYIQAQSGSWKLIEERDISNSIKPRKAFSHKGNYGHALIIAGNTETMGAALLCADACLHAGAGLSTASIPENGLSALNSYAPEVMYLPRKELSTALTTGKYDAVAIGPGLGKEHESVDLVRQTLNLKDTALVIDADGLNILASNPNLINQLPHKCIICPHVKEFDRLFGKSNNWWDRVSIAVQKAKELGIIILLKNQYTFIVQPDGNILINPTGNPAMAVGGMGDVLTGMIAAFLAQGYSPETAAILSVYLHGYAGDELKEMNSVPPRYLTRIIPGVIHKFTSPSQG